MLVRRHEVAHKGAGRAGHLVSSDFMTEAASSCIAMTSFWFLARPCIRSLFDISSWVSCERVQAPSWGESEACGWASACLRLHGPSARVSRALVAGAALAGSAVYWNAQDKWVRRAPPTRTRGSARPPRAEL